MGRWTRGKPRKQMVSFAASLSVAGRRHPFECQLLHSGGGLRDIEIAFRIGRDLVARSTHARWFDVATNLELLAVANENAIAAADIEVLLAHIRTPRQIRSKR